MGTGWRRAFCTSISSRDQEAIAKPPPSSSSSRQCSSTSSSPNPSPSPRSYSIKFGFRSSSIGSSKSASSTPRSQSYHHNPSPSEAVGAAAGSSSLRCRTTAPPSSASAPSSAHNSPRLLHCKTTSSISTTPISTPSSTKTRKPPRFFHNSNPSSPKSPTRFSLFRTSSRLSKSSSCGICLQSVKTGQGTAIFTAECSHAFHFPCIAAHVKKNGTLVCPVCTTNWREAPLLAIHKNQQQQEQEQPPLMKPAEEEEEQVKKILESSIRDVKTVKKETEKCTKPTNPKPKPKPLSADSRVYDDDEPLMSPTAGARFVTIPEETDEDGDDEEEIQEFQGFFVDPNRSPSSPTTNKSDSNKSRDSLVGLISRNVEVKLLPVSAVVSVGRSSETYAVALKVKAPPPPARSTTNAPLLDPTRRAPIDLVTVLDVSGSMSGAKLQMLKRAMRLVISSLSSSDRLSIIAFSGTTKRLLPLKRMSVPNQRLARRIIDRLVCGQGSSVGDALRKATKVLEDRRERNPVGSIMLLSDGQDERSSANSANRRQSSTASSTRFGHLEIPVHASGYGENGANGTEPAEDAFAKCVGGLLSVVVQDLRLKLSFSSGSEITAVYSCTGKPQYLGSNSIRIGDLYAEEERELLVELKVPMSAVGAHHVISVRSCYREPATQEMIYGKEQPLLVPRPHAVRSSDPKIERIRNLFITTRAIAEARRLVEHNDHASAYGMLTSARALLKQCSSISSDEYLHSLEAELAELQWRRQHQHQVHHQQQQQQTQIQRQRTNEREVVHHQDESTEPLTPTSAWRAAERLAKVAIMRKSMNRVGDLHGFENARF